MKPKVLAVIPARLGSRRFPSKVLYPFRGKPLLYYIWNEIKKCKNIDRLVIATDSIEVKKEAAKFGAEIVITPKRLKTGSDRAALVAEQLGGDYIVNIQADNFGVKNSVLDKAILEIKSDKKIAIATFGRKIDSDKELFNPNCVKIALGANGNTLWFSRFPLPYLQNVKSGKRSSQYKFYKHIGIYLFRSKVLRDFAATRQTATEKAESLEQLRMLEIGIPIHLMKTKMKTVSIDQPEDVNYLNAIYR